MSSLPASSLPTASLPVASGAALHVRPRTAERVACFAVQALADPGLLPRVLELFAKRGLVPERFFAQAEGQGREAVTLDIQVAGFDPQLTDYVARCLRQIPQVTAVLTTEKLAG